MEKERYMISDAAILTGVESHVLRYWEDELELEIPRNEQGHRYYTKDNIAQFQQIKELKDRGYQLKTIRKMLHSEGQKADKEMPNTYHRSQLQEQTPEVKMQQFREVMDEIVSQAIRRNNDELSQMIGEQVKEQVIKEMDYLVREQESLEEERYRKLDAAIRGEVRRRRFPFHKEKIAPQAVTS